MSELLMKNKNCFGRIKPKNKDQALALKYLLDPEIDLVVLDGVAGSGKTFLSVAAALSQIVDYKLYKELIFTRSPCPLGQDLGFLPGSEEEKLAPWCGGFRDNLEALVDKDSLTMQFIESKIKIKAMQFMRGRSFIDKFIIIDEVQNMHINELKVLITRAGEGTKIVCLGDVSQIDDKRLSTENNALSSLIDTIEYYEPEFVKYVELPESERSRLCRWASEAL